MKQFIAIDIGGTGIKYGVVEENGNILFSSTVPTYAKDGGTALLERVKKLALELIKKYPKVEGIGISSAGVIDEISGKVIYASENIPKYTGINVKKEVENATNLKVCVENDVNCFALSEKYFGSGKNYYDILCITLGTGIGAGIIINGELYRGRNKRAGEIGYILKDKNGENYEERASTIALIKKLREKGISLDGKEFFEKVKEGDVFFKGIFQEWIDEICKGIVDMCYLLAPEVVIIGGGVSAQGEFLINALKEGIVKNGKSDFSVNIVPSTSGPNGNLIGAIIPFILDR